MANLISFSHFLIHTCIHSKQLHQLNKADSVPENGQSLMDRSPSIHVTKAVSLNRLVEMLLVIIQKCQMNNGKSRWTNLGSVVKECVCNSECEDGWCWRLAVKLRQGKGLLLSIFLLTNNHHHVLCQQQHHLACFLQQVFLCPTHHQQQTGLSQKLPNAHTAQYTFTKNNSLNELMFVAMVYTRGLPFLMTVGWQLFLNIFKYTKYL